MVTSQWQNNCVVSTDSKWTTMRSLRVKKNQMKENAYRMCTQKMHTEDTFFSVSKWYWSSHPTLSKKVNECRAITLSSYSRFVCLIDWLLVLPAQLLLLGGWSWPWLRCICLLWFQNQALSHHWSALWSLYDVSIMAEISSEMLQ